MEHTSSQSATASKPLQKEASSNLKLLLYVDIGSQAARAIMTFVRAMGLKHEIKTVAMRRLEHKSDEYMKINPQGKIPAVQEVDELTGEVFDMYESKTVMRYLCDSRSKDVIPDHWYPEDLRRRARVDEYLDSHFYHFQSKSGLYIFKKVHTPLLFGKTYSDKELENDRKGVSQALDLLEKRLSISGGSFLCGNQISIADLAAQSDLDSLQFVSYEIDAKKYPLILQWHSRVLNENPAIMEVHQEFCKLIKLQKAAARKKQGKPKL